MSQILKITVLLFLNIIFAVIVLVLFAARASAQVSGSCWEVKSDLKKAKRYACSAVNDGPFVVPVDQHRVLRQLKSTRPIPHALVLERAATHNRNHGNSRLERFERRGLPMLGILGAASVIGSGVVTAGVSAALPIVVPGIRSWFMEASPPLWSEAPQLLSDQEIIMEPGSSAGFWFYAEKGGMEGEFRILPLEMGVVESKLSVTRPPSVVFSNLIIDDFTANDTVPYAVRRISQSVETALVQQPVNEPSFRYYLRTVARSAQ